MRLIDVQGKRRHVEHYLTTLRSMASEMRMKEERIEALRALADGVRSLSCERISGGKKRDLVDIENELEELLEEYAGDLSRYASDIAEGYRICPSSNIPRYICWAHWVEGLTWGEVANKVGYSRDHVTHKLCQQGVEEIYDHLPLQWRDRAESAL